MPKCPICYTEYIEGAATCSACHWNLEPCNLPKTGQYRKAYAKKEQAYIQWAREMWLKYLAQSHSPVNPSIHFIPWPNHSHPSENSHHHLDESLISQLESRLESRLSQLESRCQELEAKITELISELANEAKYRSQMESQMEWVLYVLQEANPQEMQQTLWQLQEWANSLANSQPENHLQSEVGMDYSKLEKLLAGGKWRQADQRTWDMMLRVTNREDQGFLNPEDIEMFPTTDLLTIAWLWEHYSGGLFGLTIQKQIWENSHNNYTDFCDRVGWKVKDNWLYYEELNCSLEAQQGHLPVIGWRKRACYGMGGATAEESFRALISRFTESK